MNKLRFAKDEGTEFYKELRQQLDEYFETNKIERTGNAVMKVKIVFYFGLNILLYGLMLTSNSLLSFYFFYLLGGLAVLLAVFNIAHDAAHGVACKSKFWNSILFQISFNLLGNNAYVWGRYHSESHHLYTNVEGSDIDVLNNPLIRMTGTQPLKRYYRYQHLYAPFLYLLYSLNWIVVRTVLSVFRISDRTIQIEVPFIEKVKHVCFRLLYFMYMLGLPLYVLPFSILTIITAFLIYHAFISLIIVGVLGITHLSDYVSHPEPDAKGILSMSWPKLQLCTSVDYNTNSKFLNWTLGGFNAHTLHHLLPKICHVHYLNILPIFKTLVEKHGLVYQELSYGKSLASHFRFLKSMGNTQNPKPRVYER
jgi:linoleoyl-CoA desaturase